MIRIHALAMIAAIGMLAWPQHVLWHETYAEMYAEQVMDQTTDVLYTLAPDAGNATILRATDLRTGRVRRGSGSYKQDGLVLAGGYLWVYGGNVLEQVDPGTLATIRSVDLSAEGVADGPAGSVWVGESRDLVRVSVRTGAVLGRAGVPAGMDLDDVDGLPGSGYLYAAAQRTGSGYGAVVLEYAAASGRLLARTSADPLPFSLAGADLTAVPGGVWVSFRSGMDGQSMLLSAASLRVRSVPASLSLWAMTSTAVYSGGTLWVMTGDGVQACVDPATGRVRAEQTVISSTVQPAIVLGAAAGEVIALVIGEDSAVVVGISAPRAC